MSQQTYPVRCECGKVHQCPAGYAGTRFACPCGKAVEVPALSKLRAAAGVGGGSPELEISYRLREGSLPLETECVCCGTETDGFAAVAVVCEREEQETPMRWWYWLFLPLGCWAVVLFLAAHLRGRDRTFGRDVAFRLPVRVCDRCDSQLHAAAGVVDALRETALYARLLDKYPHADIFPLGATAPVRRPTPAGQRFGRRVLGWIAGVAAAMVVFFTLMVGFYAGEMWVMGGGHWYVVSWGSVEFVRTPLPEPGPDTSLWTVMWTAGMLVFSAAVALLLGVGVARVVGGIHRHFRPDPPAE